jgi:transposase
MDRVSPRLMLRFGPIKIEQAEAMRGDDIQRDSTFSYLSPEARVPKDHPLRPLRQIVNRALRDLSRDFQAMCSSEGCPSIPPEKLLRALLLQLFYTICSERLLMEQLGLQSPVSLVCGPVHGR